MNNAPSESNLAPVAKEVLPFLYEIHEKLSENVAEINMSLRNLANEIISQGLLPEAERMSPLDLKRRIIVLKTGLAKIKSDLIIRHEQHQSALPEDQRSERGALIIDNFITKLTDIVEDIPGLPVEDSDAE